MPLPVVLALLIQDTSTVLEIFFAYPLFTLISLTLSASLLVLVFRVVRPQFYFERGSALIFLVSLLGLLVYIYGSYVGEFSLHWLSLPLVYLGFVGYLGGRRATAPLVPGIIGIALVPLPTYVSSTVIDAASVVALATLALSTISIVRFKGFDSERCEYCRTYVGNGRTFCNYCGKNLYPVRFELSGKRLLKVTVASFFVILFLTLSVTSVAFSSSGIYLAHYSLAGEREGQPLLLVGGLKESPNSFSSNSTVARLDYSMKGSPEINATIFITPSHTVSFNAALARHQGAKQNGSIAISPSQSGVLFNWREGGTSSTGLLFSASIRYLSSSGVQQGAASFLFSEDSSSFDKNRGRDLVSISQSVEAGLQTSQQFDPFVVGILDPVLSNSQYALPASSVALLGLVAGVARRMDSPKTRRLDNSLGLRKDEFGVLAYISTVKGGRTGSEILRNNGEVSDWGMLAHMLEKFRGLDLLVNKIKVVNGVPFLLWDCNL